MAGNVTKRNGLIDLERFVFSIFIVLFHSENYRNSIMPNGYIAVEFFLILSGYLLAKKADSYKGTDLWNDNIKLLLHKYFSFLPFVVLSAVFGSLIYSILWGDSADVFMTLIVMSLVDCIPLQMFGFSGFFVTGVSWYLCVLLFCTFLYFPILVKKRDVFIKYLAPIIVLFFYGFIIKKTGTFQPAGDWYGAVHLGMLRGIAGIALGTIAYETTKKIDSMNQSKLNKLLISFAPLLIVVLTAEYSLFSEDFRNFELHYLLLLFVLVVTSFSQNNDFIVACDKKVFSFLGKISLSVYLCHFYVASAIPMVIDDVNSNEATILYLGTVLLLTMVNYFVGKLLVNKKTRLYTVIGLIVLVVAVLFFYK